MQPIESQSSLHSGSAVDVFLNESFNKSNGFGEMNHKTAEFQQTKPQGEIEYFMFEAEQ